MVGLGTIINVVMVLVGGTAGLFLKKLLPQKLTDTIMQGVGMAVIIIGLSGCLKSASEHTLIMIISLALGALIGELIGIEEGLNSFSNKFEAKLSKVGGTSTFSQGFVTATLVFCVGAMAIVGSIEDGINRNPDILIAKSVLDFIAAMVFASTLGVGVLFSVLPIAVYQGLITLLAVFIAPYLNDTVIAQMTVVGSVLIVGIGFNMLKIAKIKVGNLLPAIFIPVVYYAIASNF